MDLRRAHKICEELNTQFSPLRRGGKSVKWSDVYSSEQDIIADLNKVVIPDNRTAPAYTFSGYMYIYSFAKQVQAGTQLTPKQMTKCKQLAVEIKKAAAIAECY